MPNSGQQLCGFYDVKPALFNVIQNLRTRASNYGKRSEVFNGVDVTLTTRFAQRGQFSGGLSVGRTVLDACEVTAKVPEALQGIDTITLAAGGTTSWTAKQNCRNVRPWSAGTQVKFLVVYPLPWELQTSATFQNVPGIPITSTYPAANASVRSSLGRDLASCRGAATCTANVSLEFLDPAANYESRLNQLDLRLTRRFRVGPTHAPRQLRHLQRAQRGIHPFDEKPVTARTAAPYEIMGGRLFKFSGRLNFEREAWDEKVLRGWDS